MSAFARELLIYAVAAPRVRWRTRASENVRRLKKATSPFISGRGEKIVQIRRSGERSTQRRRQTGGVSPLLGESRVGLRNARHAGGGACVNQARHVTALECQQCGRWEELVRHSNSVGSRAPVSWIPEETVSENDDECGDNMSRCFRPTAVQCCRA